MRTMVALESGTWADWANAAATTLAFAIALVLFVIGLRDRRRADDERRRANEDRLRDQARKIWIWVTDYEGGLKEGHFRVHKIDYEIANNSDDPITRCVVAVVSNAGGAFTPQADKDKDPDVWVVRAGESHRGTLNDASVERIDVPPAAERPASWPGPLELYFTDAAGVRWHRDSEGLLSHDMLRER